MTRASSSGQILVLVLLIVLVGLTVGLSIASRTLSTIKNAGNLDQSNRAYSAAEAGVEKALALIKASPTACDAPANCAPSGLTGVQDTNVTVLPVGGNSNALGFNNVKQDDVRQLSFDPADPGNGCQNVDLYWGSFGDLGNGIYPSVVVSVVYKNSSSVYGMAKWAIDSNNSRASSNGFTPLPGAANDDPPDSFPLQNGATGSAYGYKYTIPVSSGVPSCSAAGNQPVLMRVRVMYSDAKKLAFKPTGSATFTSQGKQITSTATSGGKQRTITVFQSNAQMPAIFDYALFNGSTNPLTK
jgi:hypothetical protein